METNDQQEASQFILDLCTNIIVTLATQHKIDSYALHIRIDLDNVYATPVFGVFENNNEYQFSKPTLNDIIIAGGGKDHLMIAGMYVREIVQQIFAASLKRLEITDPKRLFVLLYLQRVKGNNLPKLAIFQDGEFIDEAPLGEIIKAA